MNNGFRFTVALVISLVAGALSSNAATPAERAEVEALREQLRVLDQRLRTLERQLEARDSAASPNSTAGAAEPVTDAGASGFGLMTADKKFQLRLGANTQGDARFFLGDNVEGNDTFLVRRLVLRFEGNLTERFAFRLMPDLAPGNFTLQESYAVYQPSPAFNLLVGKTKSPFDLERLVSQTDLLFIERSYPTSLSPNRDIGVQLFGDVAAGTLSYQLALLNGARDNDSTIVDVDDAKEVVARLVAHPFRRMSGSPLRGIGVGVAASVGEKNHGSPNVYRTNAQQIFFSWRDTTANTGEHTRVEPQAYWYAGPLGLIGSWVTSRQTLSHGPGSLARAINNTAWYAAASWVLTGEDASYRSVVPRTNFSLSDGTWGAFEIAARYGELSIDDAAFPLFADAGMSAHRAQGATLGLNWFLSRHVKASVNFEHTTFGGGANNPVTREDENAVLTRVQLRY